MKGMLTISFVLFSALVATNQIEPSDKEKELVSRFQGHIESYQKNKPANNKAELLSTRARLLVAEKQLSLQKENNSDNYKATPQRIQAAVARIDHYKRKIKILEKKIINRRTGKKIKQ